MDTPFYLLTPSSGFARTALAAGLLTGAVGAYASSLFINEIHYDNRGPDIGEAIEIAGRAGADLAGWKLLLYNGNDGKVYRTRDLQGSVPDQAGGHGTLTFDFPSGAMQNGAPDGIALVDSSNAVIQFLSYEGSFLASDGPANGMLSTDIGVAETVNTPVDFSLQLTGAGALPADFTWAPPQPQTFGAANIGQTFVPLPAALPLLFSAIAGIGLFCCRYQSR